MHATKILKVCLASLAFSLIFAFHAHAQQIDSLTYKTKSVGAFMGLLKASGLRSTHKYVLTLNGIPGRPGNEILKRYQEYGKEGYFDFKWVTTDDNGGLMTEINRKLPKGEYFIKFLIKDPDQDYLVVAIESFVEFVVK